MKEKTNVELTKGRCCGEFGKRFFPSSSLSLFPLFCFAQAPTTLGENSLLNPTASRGLIVRRTAAHKGDVLTIRVNEVMQGQYKANTATNKSVAASVDKVSLPIVDAFAGPVLGNILGGQAGTPRRLINGLLGGGTTGAKEASSGGGSSDTSSQFSTTLSVKVVDVDANGNLLVEGFRFLRVNKELQKMTLTGTVRPDDILPDNSIASDKIANANIEADGKGAVAAKTRRSLVNRILDWLF